MQIPSWPAVRLEWLAAIVACLLAGCAGHAMAHESASRAIPEDTGVRMGAALALSQASADEAWPAMRLPGILGSGETPVDRRGSALEHATLDAGLRLNAWLGATVAWGWHDADPPHMEAAWLQGDHEWGDDSLQFGLGRNRLPMGAQIEGGGHFDRFAAMPLAKRAVLNGDWIDDGASLRWQRDHNARWSWLEAIDAGMWRARSFPGGPGAGAAPTIHAQLRFGPVQLDGFASTVRPTRRGAHLQNALATHTHSLPDCKGSLTGIFCFDGRSDVLGASAAWALPWRGLQLQTSGLLRRDRGLLYSANGEAQYRGTTAGSWSDLIWPINLQFTLALRTETLRGVQTLEGPSAAVMAIDAGLMGSTRLSRQAISLAYTPINTLRLSLEGGADKQGSTRNGFMAIRLVWTPGTLWSRSW